MAKTGKQYCVIDQWEEYEKVRNGLMGKAAYVNLVQSHGTDFSSKILQLAEKTLKKEETIVVNRWPGTALSGNAPCHQYNCTMAFLMQLDALIKDTGPASNATELVKKVLYHDDLQIMDASGELLLFTVARNGTVAAWDGFVL